MANPAPNDKKNGIEVAKFKFFKKRRQKSRKPGPVDFSKLKLTKDSNNMKNSQGFSQVTNSSPENSRNSRRKKLDSQSLNSFKEVLKDLEEYDKSQHSINENDVDVSDNSYEIQNINPDYPNIDLRKCVPVYYTSWVRDQLLYGNSNICILNDNERKIEEILHELKTKIENLKKHPGVNNNQIEIHCLLYSRHMSLYKSYLNLVREGDCYNRFNIITTTDGVYIRVINTEISQSYDTLDFAQFSQFDPGSLTHDNIILNFTKEYNLSNSQTGSNLYIGEHYITGPTFINSFHIPLNNVPIEYLPIKMSKEYMGNRSDTSYFKDYITQSLWYKATKELIIVKALVNISSIPLSKFEGFDIYNISAGERFWVPLYIAERLCYLGLVYIEVPLWLLPDLLKDIHGKENSTDELSKLPSDYFFEIAHAFMSLSLFKRICFPPSKNKLYEHSMFSIISKSSGIVEDIKGCRENKIHTFISTLKTQNFFSIQNLQYSETYIISQFLGAFWPSKIKYMNQFDSKHWKDHVKDLSKQLKKIIIN